MIEAGVPLHARGDRQGRRVVRRAPQHRGVERRSRADSRRRCRASARPRPRRPQRSGRWTGRGNGDRARPATRMRSGLASGGPGVQRSRRARRRSPGAGGTPPRRWRRGPGVPDAARPGPDAAARTWSGRRPARSASRPGPMAMTGRRRARRRRRRSASGRPRSRHARRRGSRPRAVKSVRAATAPATDAGRHGAPAEGVEARGTGADPVVVCGDDQNAWIGTQDRRSPACATERSRLLTERRTIATAGLSDATG